MRKLTQRQKILKLLKENRSVNSFDLTYIYAIKQANTRIFELKAEGWDIITTPSSKHDKSVDFSLSNYEEIKTPIRYEFKDNIAIPIYKGGELNG